VCEKETKANLKLLQEDINERKLDVREGCCMKGMAKDIDCNGDIEHSYQARGISFTV